MGGGGVLLGRRAEDMGLDARSSDEEVRGVPRGHGDSLLKTTGGVAFTAATFALQVWLTAIVLSWFSAAMVVALTWPAKCPSGCHRHRRRPQVPRLVGVTVGGPRRTRPRPPGENHGLQLTWRELGCEDDGGAMKQGTRRVGERARRVGVRGVGAVWGVCVLRPRRKSNTIHK